MSQRQAFGAVSRSRTTGSAMVVVVALAIGAVAMFGSPARAADPPVGLGTAESFAVLAGTTVTNKGPSRITGDLGVSPGTAVVGFPPGVVNGAIHAGDAVALEAQSDVTTAYNDAAGRSTTGTITADLGGQRLVPGVYSGGALGLTGTLTLDGGGDPDAVFIFQAASTLITAPASVVAFVNGADPCRVFWQVTSSATLGTTSRFVGTILALTSIAAQTGASVAGRLLARNGAVTLDSNVVTRSTCAGDAPTTSTTAAGSDTTTSTTEASDATTTTAASGTAALIPSGSTTALIPSGSAASMNVTTATTGHPGGVSGTATTVARRGSPAGSASLARTGTAGVAPVVASLLLVGLGSVMLVASRRKPAR